MSRENLKDIAHWHDTPYRSENTAAYDNFEADYGLPENLDLTPFRKSLSRLLLNCRMEAPQVAPGHSATLVGPCLGTFASRRWAIGVGFIPLDPAPYVRDYMAEAEVAMNEYTPQDMELNEILKTQGLKAFDRRAREHQRDTDRKKQRKLYRANYERYAAEAKAKNIQRAAEKLVAEKLAAENAAAAQAQSDQSGLKKPPMSAAADAAQSGLKEAQKTA